MYENVCVRECGGAQMDKQSPPKTYETCQKKVYENTNHSVVKPGKLHITEASILLKLQHKTSHSPRTLEWAGSHITGMGMVYGTVNF